jgi:23S rRNA (adenine2503-C2)-methyltransferase
MQTALGMTTSEFELLAEKLSQPRYRAKQMSKAVYRDIVSSWNQVSNLPLALRESLEEVAPVTSATIAHRAESPDGAIKYLLNLHDGEQIESVYLPYEERVSVCVSSQVGCPAGCKFCATAQGGLARNLTRGEIVEQVLALQRENPERRISHCVFMGMGEPLFNYDEVIGAVRLLVDEVGMSARKITISTVGVPDGIRQLADEGLPVTLALSLHAPTDSLRETLIPTAKKWKLAEILYACREYVDSTHRDLTFEYLLLGGLNDRPDQAKALAKAIDGLPGNVNIIPFNWVETKEGFRRPSAQAVRAFREELEKCGRVATQRVERGHSVSAACGQLRRTAGTFRGKAIALAAS